MIAFIGTGKVGTSLCKYFIQNNLEISGVYDKDFDSAKESSEFLGVKLYDTMYSLINNSEVIFITVNDDNIINVWEDIKQKSYENKIFIHCSGSFSSELLSSDKNFAYSLHPMFPFSDKFTTYLDLNHTYFSLEGNSEKLVEIKNMIENLGNKVLLISSEKKSKYHLANVMVSNLVLSLINKGSKYLEECGVSSDDAKEALMPLIKLNISNIEKKAFTEAITGPVERGDAVTLKKHIDVLEKQDIKVYKNLSENLVEIAKEKNKTRDYSKLVGTLRSDI